MIIRGMAEAGKKLKLAISRYLFCCSCNEKMRCNTRLLGKAGDVAQTYGSVEA
jgi:hypothetical protein